MRNPSFRKPLLAVLLSLLCIEGLLQIAALANERIAVLLSAGIPIGLPDPLLGERPNPALPDHDARGYRNPAALERADVVVLGDSQTYGAEVSRANAWPTLLGDMLEVPTYNMGFGGWGPVRYYLVADQVFALQPKVVIVAIYAGNDLADAYRTSMRIDVPDLERDALLDESAFEKLTEERGPVEQSWRETRAMRKGALAGRLEAWVQPFELHCKLYGLFRGLFRIAAADEANMRTDTERTNFVKYAAKIEHLPKDNYFPFPADSVSTVFTPLGRAAVADLNDPRIEEGRRITLAVLVNFKDRCAEPCRFIVLAIPTKEFAFSQAVDASGMPVPAAYRRLTQAEKKLWQGLDEELGRHGIAMIDARLPLAQAIAEGRNPYLADWDGHPGVVGNRAIARYLAEHPLLEPVRH